MATIVTRAGKGSPLTHAEVDANFNNLNSDKAETSALGTAAFTASTDYATAAQGSNADTAVQPNDSPTFGNVTATTYFGDGSNLTGIPAGYTNSDVDAHLNAGAAASGEFLSWNGADYDWASVPAGYANSDVDAHLNTSAATSDQILSWTGSDYAWVDQSSAETSLLNYNYTATSGQTTFSGADDNAATLSYTQQNLIVTLNGIVLEDGTDYTASNGTSIVLASGAASGDELNIVAFKSFTTADMVPASTGGTFSGNITATKFLTTANKIETSIFRVNAQSLTADTTIDATENASATGPLAIATGVTLTVTTGGNLAIL